jgi:hypothetical protein
LGQVSLFQLAGLALNVKKKMPREPGSSEPAERNNNTSQPGKGSTPTFFYINNKFAHETVNPIDSCCLPRLYLLSFYNNFN